MRHTNEITWALNVLKRNDARAIEYAFAQACVDAWSRMIDSLDQPATEELHAPDQAKIGEAA